MEVLYLLGQRRGGQCLPPPPCHEGRLLPSYLAMKVGHSKYRRSSIAIASIVCLRRLAMKVGVCLEHAAPPRRAALLNEAVRDYAVPSKPKPKPKPKPDPTPTLTLTLLPTPTPSPTLARP
eukprot:scaffold63466_cov46-Phaeocystis_antarctica.AAC.1